MATETRELLGELDDLKADLLGQAPELEAPVAPGAGQVIEGVFREAAPEPLAPPVAPGIGDLIVEIPGQGRPGEPILASRGDGGNGGSDGKLPEAPPSAPALSVEDQYAKLGEPITRARAAREADKAALPERQRKFLDSRGEVQRAVGEAAGEAAPLRLDDDQRSRLEGLRGKLGVLHDRVTPLPDSLVAEKAGRRGALSETDVAVRQETVAKWNEEIACQQAVLESLNIEGRTTAAEEAQRAHIELGREYEDVAQRAAEAGNKFELARTAYLGERQRMGNLVRDGALTQEEADQLLVTKETPGRALSEQVAVLRVQEKEASLRAAEAKAKADGLRAEEEAARAAAREVEGMIGQRRAGIDAAVAEMAVSDQVTERTRQQLVRAGERIGRSQTETSQKLEANRVVGDIQEMQAFVDRIAGVRILPGGLENQLRLLDQRIDYLRQPGTIENLDPALAGAVEDTVDAFGGGDAGRDRYLAKLLGDRTNLQILRDVADNPNSLIDAPYYVPDVLRQAAREAQAESARREQGQEGGAGIGFLEGGSDNPVVNNLYELRRGVAAKFVESLGVRVPVGLAEQEHLSQVGAELRAMLESDQAPAGWGEIYKQMDIREEGKKNVAEAEARVAEAKQRVEELTAQLEEERKVGGEKVAGLEQQLTAAQAQAEAERQRAEALEPVAGEAQGQITLALESAVRDLGSAVIPDGLKAPLVAGETLAYRLAAIEGWRQDELKKQLRENKQQLGVNPETDKAGDGREHEKSVKRVDDILTQFQAREANDKTIQSTLNELRQVPGIGPAMAEVFSKMVSRLQANRGSLSDDDITEAIGKDSNLRKLLGVPELAGIGAGAVAGMLPLFEGMFNTALASMGLAGR